VTPHWEKRKCLKKPMVDQLVPIEAEISKEEVFSSSGSRRKEISCRELTVVRAAHASFPTDGGHKRERNQREPSVYRRTRLKGKGNIGSASRIQRGEGLKVVDNERTNEERAAKKKGSRPFSKTEGGYVKIRGDSPARRQKGKKKVKQ